MCNLSCRIHHNNYSSCWRSFTTHECVTPSAPDGTTITPIQRPCALRPHLREAGRNDVTRTPAQSTTPPRCTPHRIARIGQPSFSGHRERTFQPPACRPLASESRPATATGKSTPRPQPPRRTHHELTNPTGRKIAEPDRPTGRGSRTKPAAGTDSPDGDAEMPAPRRKANPEDGTHDTQRSLPANRQARPPACSALHHSALPDVGHGVTFEPGASPQ